MGERQLLRRFLAHLGRASHAASATPFSQGLVHYAMGRYTNAFEPEPYKTVEHYRTALVAFRAAGNRRECVSVAGDLGLALARIGAFPAAEEVLRTAVALAQRLQEPGMILWAQMCLALVLAVRPEHGGGAEALALGNGLRSNVGEYTIYGAIINCALAAAYLATGDLIAAEACARSAVQGFQPLRTSAPLGYVMLLRVLVAQGRAAAALSVAEEAAGLLQSLDGAGSGEVPLLLALADTRAAAGQQVAAAATRSAAQAQIELRAARIPDENLRAGYLWATTAAEAPPLI